MCLYAISVQRGADEVACHSCRGRRPSSSWNSISYIAANHRRRAGFNTEHGHGTREATISTLVEAVVRFLGGAMEVDSRHESKGERKEEKFVNEGLIKWKEGRKKWLAASASGQKRPRRRPPRVDDEVILETIFAKPTGWLLPHPVPLAHMVELLEDEWSD